jgi:alpha-ketoglutaric semialdehyde dehydrogenase
MEPILTAGRFLAVPAKNTFAAVDPSTGERLPEIYPVSNREQLARMAEAGKRAAAALRGVPAERLADFLERYAAAIEADADAIAQRASLETGLPYKPRLREVEMGRTLLQLRQAAAAAREKQWALPTVDAENDLRSGYFPLGGVVFVLGPSNFPLAFNGVAGGDFAAAIAAGNPVIAKAHPGYPGTTRLLAACAERALAQCPGLPAALVQMFYHCEPDDGLWLIGQREIAAVAFTGSKAGGLRIKEAADRAGKPAYLEMSSVNPVFVLPGAVAGKATRFVDDFVGSSLLGAGQMCTNPGLVVLPSGVASEAIVAQVAARLRSTPPGVLLGEGGPRQLESAVQTLCGAGAQLVAGGQRVAGPAYRFDNTLLRVGAKQFLAQAEALQTEAFGATSLFILCDNDDEMVAVAEALHGNLTGCVYSAEGEQDEPLYGRIAPILCERVGRLLNDKMPTGVTVSPAMNHGGPYPATGHPGFTAVGMPASLRRFAKLTCFDRVRSGRLPELLRGLPDTKSTPNTTRERV